MKNKKIKIMVLIMFIIVISTQIFSGCTKNNDDSQNNLEEPSNSEMDTSVEIKKFKSLAYTGIDTNYQQYFSDYVCNDSEFINKIWGTLNADNWKDEALETTGMTDLVFRFTTENDETIYLSVDILNIGKYNDKLYKLPDGLYDQVAEMLKEYTAQHFSTVDISIVDEMLMSGNIHVVGDEYDLYTDSTQGLEEIFNTKSWQKVSPPPDGPISNSIMFSSSYKTEITFLILNDLVSVQKNDITAWYKVDHKIITDIISKLDTLTKNVISTKGYITFSDGDITDYNTDIIIENKDIKSVTIQDSEVSKVLKFVLTDEGSERLKQLTTELLKSDGNIYVYYDKELIAQPMVNDIIYDGIFILGGLDLETMERVCNGIN